MKVQWTGSVQELGHMVRRLQVRDFHCDKIPVGSVDQLIWTLKALAALRSVVLITWSFSGLFWNHWSCLCWIFLVQLIYIANFIYISCSWIRFVKFCSSDSMSHCSMLAWQHCSFEIFFEILVQLKFGSCKSSWLSFLGMSSILVRFFLICEVNSHHIWPYFSLIQTFL